MSAAVPDDMMAIVIPMLYAVTTHWRPASPTLKSDWMAGNATFTINASRKIMKRPRLVAARVKRCVLVIGRSKVPCRQELWPSRLRYKAKPLPRPTGRRLASRYGFLRHLAGALELVVLAALPGQ